MVNNIAVVIDPATTKMKPIARKLFFLLVDCFGLSNSSLQHQLIESISISIFLSSVVIVNSLVKSLVMSFVKSSVKSFVKSLVGSIQWEILSSTKVWYGGTVHWNGAVGTLP